MRIVGSFFAFLVLAAFASAKTYRLSPSDNWFDLLHGNGLRAGDEVILGAGTYSNGRMLELSHVGTKQKPIVIRAADKARVVFHRPDARQNTFNLAGTQHLTVKGLEITGGSTAIRIYKQGSRMAKFVTLEALHVHHVGGPAVTCNHTGNLYEGMIFRRNHIHHTSGHGEAFYLGSNSTPDGKTQTQFFHGIIDGNYLHDLNGPKVSQGDGIELKDGSWGNLVRDNVIHDVKHPGIIVYDADGKEPNVIEGNLIFNVADNGIQVAADAIIRNNLIFNCKGTGIYSRDHQSAVVGNLKILHNTVVNKGKTALRLIAPAKGKYSGPILIANNAFYAGVAMQIPGKGFVTFAGNAGQGSISGRKFGQAEWKGHGNLIRDLTKNLYPRFGSILIGAANPKYSANKDFERRLRDSSRDSGAYRFDAKGPHWPIKTGFKPVP
ncbi:MAG: chloramphenicol resistance protein [Opitutae bacterium]|jgi:hypothetical protein|nr:chloramphenicol resistance protein [Opitutae bacterium]